jgi:hypothetical protein
MPKIFPKAANRLPLQIVIYLCVVGAVATAGVDYYMTPKFTRVGYAPVQPVPFSHEKHVSELGLDCRYCHNYEDKSAHSNVPTAQTCMNCHNQVATASPALQVVRDSYASGQPVPWIQVHRVPDYVYFNHSIHVNRGISCVECHGQVNQMDVVMHMKPLSMGFCLDCHRAPEEHVRMKSDIFNLDSPTIAAHSGLAAAKTFVHDWRINPPQSCSGCHR